MIVKIVALAILLGGCAPTIYGPAGEYDGSFECRGNGTITGSGHLDLGAGIGGGQGNAWTMSLNCGDSGLKIIRHRERTKPSEQPTGSQSDP